MNPTTRKRLLWAAAASALVAVGVYEGSGYLIGAIYGGAMKAHRRAVSEAKPQGWATDNMFFGRWQGLSTAGMAVIGVLNVEPDRVRWGNAANGICDSGYTVEQLPWGRKGTYPDQLVPPSEPTDLTFAVARLTLKPKPCSTGDAVIQLAMPLDGSSELEVNTYDAKGQLSGSYGRFEPIRD